MTFVVINGKLSSEKHCSANVIEKKIIGLCTSIYLQCILMEKREMELITVLHKYASTNRI